MEWRRTRPSLGCSSEVKPGRQVSIPSSGLLLRGRTGSREARAQLPDTFSSQQPHDQLRFSLPTGPQFPAWLKQEQWCSPVRGCFSGFFSQLLYNLNIARHLDEFVLVSAPCIWCQGIVCPGKVVYGQNGVGPLFAEGICPWMVLRGNSAYLRVLLLTLTVPICSDLKDQTEATVSGIILGHRPFRKGRYLILHRSHPWFNQDNFCSFPLDSMTQRGLKQ